MECPVKPGMTIWINYPRSSAASLTCSNASTSQRFRFDLTNTLARHRELLADFFQRVVGVHAEAHAEHAFFARGERGEHAGGGLA
jgi:hypothetical protein